MKRTIEEIARNDGYRFPVGIDECGRGALVGPVVAVAIFLPPHLNLGKNQAFIRDSKKLSKPKRQEMFELLTTTTGVEYGIGIVTHDRIDEINILNAAMEAMEKSVQNMKITPDILLVDGNKSPKNIMCEKQTVIEGDTIEMTIAAASIIAKVTRDHIMLAFDQIYPHWGFAQNMGYGAKSHMDLIKSGKTTPIHRKTFNPLKSILFAKTC